MLLAGDVSLQASYNIQPNGKRSGLEWARVIPKDKQSDVREALFGFKGRELARLEIVDKLGQRSTLVFSNVKRNAAVDPKLMQFTLPPAPSQPCHLRGLKEDSSPVSCSLYTRRPRSLRRCDPPPRWSPS